MCIRDRREGDKFSSWLIGISRRVASEWRRKRGRDRHQFGDSNIVEAVSPPTLGWNDQTRAINHALMQLSDDERLAVHLFYLQEQAADEARVLLNLSRSGFYRLLERARDKLAELLADAV